MEIVTLVLVIVMCVFSLCVMIGFIAHVCNRRKSKNCNSTIDTQLQKKYKEILSTSDSSQKCANATWEAVSHNVTVFMVNKRKSKYSDERESKHFNANLTDKRLATLDRMDGECQYGRY